MNPQKHLSDGVSRLLYFATKNPAKWGEIFRTVHCHRCNTADGRKQNAWKKSKRAVHLELSVKDWEFVDARVANAEGVTLKYFNDYDNLFDGCWF